jgi:Zn-dependent oligopeptidase
MGDVLGNRIHREFLEKGASLFDPQVGAAYRKSILARGGEASLLKLVKQFLDQDFDPCAEALQSL